MTKYETKMAFIRGDRSVFHAWTKLTQLGWAKKNQHWQKRPFPCSEVCCCKPAHRARDSFETRKELAADLEKHGRSAAQRKPLLQTLLVLAPHVASPRPVVATGRRTITLASRAHGKLQINTGLIDQRGSNISSARHAPADDDALMVDVDATMLPVQLPDMMRLQRASSSTRSSSVQAVPCGKRQLWNLETP
eukprot:s374_g7.t7